MGDKVDMLLHIVKSAKAEFLDLLRDESIPLETRMEWFANYGDDLLSIDFRDAIGDSFTLEMGDYLESGFTEEDIPRIKDLLHKGFSEEL